MRLPARRRDPGVILPLLAAVAVAAAMAAAAGGAPAAHAQSVEEPTVAIGALMDEADEGFSDANRTAVLRYAVDRFNERGAGFNLTLAVTNITRGSEPAGLAEAYGGGRGPLFYIGPTTSDGIVNIQENATSKAILDNIVLVSPSSDAPQLAIANDTIFRLAVSAARQGDILLGEMRSAGIDSFVTIALDDAWGRGIAGSASRTAAGMGIENAALIPFGSNDTSAYWRGIVAQAEAAVQGGSGNTGVLFVGYDDGYQSMAAAANDSSVLRQSTTWFSTDAALDAFRPAPPAAVRDFSAAVRLTILEENVTENDLTREIDSLLGGNATFYEYSTYDSVFVLGNAIAAAGGPRASAQSVAAAMDGAAMNYTGGALGGGILLDRNGDLRTPDRFTVWKVGADGALEGGGTAGTAVNRVGSLLALGYQDWPDDLTLAALRLAAADYNAAERGSLVKLVSYNITGRDVADALRGAHDGGGGPSAYIGPSLSSSLKNITGYADANGIILFSTGSEAESLAIAGDNTFRLAVSTDRQASFMGRTMAERGAESVVTIVRNDEWGRSLNGTLADTLASRGIGIAGTVPFEAGGNADWARVVADASSAISAAAPGENAVFVAFVGVINDLDGLAAAAAASDARGALTGAEWFVTTSTVSSVGFPEIQNTATRDFAASVRNMTAIDNDVVRNNELPGHLSAADGACGAYGDAVAGNYLRAYLECNVPSTWFYEFAAYDALFILGDAMGSSIASGLEGNATALKRAIPEAADAYEGILGDIALNSYGDLRTPDRFGVWFVRDGNWTDTGVKKFTPVVDIGALVVLESDAFDDSARLAAMRLAVGDFNRANEAGGPVYLNLVPLNVSLSPGAATATSPSALDAITAAAAGGTMYYVGPSTSGNSGRVLGFANDNDLTLISPSSTAPSLAGRGDALFRLVPNDSQQGVVLANIIHNQQGAILAGLINQSGHERVITVVRDDTWGQGLNASTAARLGLHGIGVTTIVHPESDARWSEVAARINSTIAGLRAAEQDGPIAVLMIGFPGDFLSLAAQSGRYPAMSSVPWYGTDGIAGTRQVVENATARSFAGAVNLTATKFDVDAGERTAAIDAALEAAGMRTRTVYEYSAYDSVFVMGRAVEAALSAKGASYGPLDVRSSVRAAAADYTGALGDVELNAAGDLRTPNSYAAWTVEGGAWSKARTYPSTPVFDVGALLMLDNNPSYTDDREKTAMDAAVDDFNTEHELIGDFYIDLAVQRITISPDYALSPDPDALAGLRLAHGAGTSLFVGPSTSGNTARILGYANDNDIVLISHSSTAPSLALPGDSLFRMVPTDTRQGVVLADLVHSGGGTTDLVMAVRGDDWGDGIHNATADELAGTGVSITRIGFGEAEGDWPAVAGRLAGAVDAAAASAASRENGAAGVLFVGFAGDLVGIAGAIPAASPLRAVPWYGPDGIGNDEDVASDPASLALARDVNLTTVVFTVPRNDVNARLDPSAVYGPSAYDAVYLMGSAIKAAYDGSGSVPPASAVRSAIPAAASAYSGALGNLTLDANGDLDSPAAYGIYRIAESGAWERVRVHSGEAGQPRLDCSAAGITCIAIGEMFTAGASAVGGINDAIHAAYALAAEDYNREQASAGSPLRVQLQRVDVPFTSPVDGVRAAYAGGSGPVAYLGPIATATAASLLPFADANGLVMVSPAATSASIAAPDGLFRLSLNDRYDADLITIAADQEGVTTVLPVVINATYGKGYAEEVGIEAAALGIEYLEPVYIPLSLEPADMSQTTAEINGRVAALGAAGTDPSTVGLVVVSLERDLHSIARHAAGYPMLASVKWFEHTALFPPAPIEDPGLLRLAQAAQLYSLSWDIDKTERLERVRDALAERGGSPPTDYSYAAYDAVHMLAAAIGMSMAADGSYTGAGAAARMHAAAEALDGLLGSDLRLDENGDRILPNRAAIWRAAADGTWIDTGDSASLGPVCSLALGSSEIAFGDVSAGELTASRTQMLKNVGTLEFGNLTIAATPWTSATTSEVAMPAGATQVMVDGGGEWMPLDGEGVTVASPAPQSEAKFRLDVPEDVPEGSSGAVSQGVVYDVSCTDPAS